MALVNKIPKNTLITCPACGAEIAKFNRDVNWSETSSVKYMTRIQSIKDGDSMRCKLCNAIYAFSGSIHTKEGWIHAKNR